MKTSLIEKTFKSERLSGNYPYSRIIKLSKNMGFTGVFVKTASA